MIASCIHSCGWVDGWMDGRMDSTQIAGHKKLRVLRGIFGPKWERVTAKWRTFHKEEIYDVWKKFSVYSLYRHVEGIVVRLHSLLTLALDENKCSVSLPSALPLGKESPITIKGGGWVAHRFGLEILEKKNLLFLLRFKPRTCQTISYSIQWLSYFDSLHNLFSLRNVKLTIIK